MLNINELESRWLTYKIKSYIPHVIIFISIIVIVLAAIYIDFSTQEQPLSTFHKEKIIPIKPQNIQQEKVVIPPVVIKKEIVIPQIFYSNIKSTQQVIQPSLDFLKNIKDDSPEYYQDYITLVPKKEVQKKTEVIYKTKKEEVLEEEIEPKPIKTFNISIQRQNTYEDIQHVIKRFKKSNNPALSLFVAKKYYDLNNYEQAYNYALITNELNSDIEESWLIFAKSLLKLNKKNKALTVLKKYINNSHSQRAQILFDNIKSGKIQ